MEKIKLVLTKKKSMIGYHENKLYMNKFYYGYDQSKLETWNVLVEENLSNKYMQKVVAADIRRMRDVLMPVFTTELNAYHNLDFSERFWKRVISKWFQQIMYNISFKYLRIKYILCKYKDKYTIAANIMARNEYQYCQEVIDFVLAEQSEKYDFQLWSQVLRFFSQKKGGRDNLNLNDVTYGEESIDDRFGKFQAHPQRKSLCKRIRRRIERTYVLLKKGKYGMAENVWLANLMEVLRSATRPVAYMYYPGFSAELFDRIIVETKGNILPLPRIIYDDAYKSDTVSMDRIDNEFRGKLKNYLIAACPNDMEYMRDVLEIAMDNIPMCFIEQLNQIRSHYQKYLLRHIKFLITMHGDYMNTAFLFYQAEMHERFGCKTIGIQHGGNYQMVRSDHLFHDYDESDIFYVWGNKDAGLMGHFKSKCEGEILESAPYKFFSYRDESHITNSKKILFAGNGVAPYALPSISISADPSRQIDALIEFFGALNEKVFKDIEYRNFMYTYGWDEMEIIKRTYPNLCIDNSTGKVNSFLQKLMNCELLVCDAMETVYMEAIALRKPFIIFMPKDAYIPWDSEQPYFQLMEENGLLHYSYKSAASLLNSIYPNIQEWWLEPSRQKAIQRLRERYWHDVEDTELWWINEMKKLVDMGKKMA